MNLPAYVVVVSSFPCAVFLVLCISACRITDIPRLNAKSVVVDLVNNAIEDACLNLGYAAATSYQEKAIKEFTQGKNVFVSLPTGEGKSLCFAALLGVFDFLKFALSSRNHLPESPSICVVVSALIALMKNR